MQCIALIRFNTLWKKVLSSLKRILTFTEKEINIFHEIDIFVFFTGKQNYHAEAWG